jgi:hypothetical protein
MKVYGELVKAQLENSASDLANVAGMVYYNTGSAEVKWYAGGWKFAADTSTAQTFTNKTHTSPVLNGTISGDAFLDEDNMASNSATKLASQQSIKAYVDTATSGSFTIDNASGTSGITVGTTDESVQTFTNSSAITVKLNNTYVAGRIITIINNGTHDITLTANDDSVIRKVYRKTVGVVICNTTSPADSTKWSGFNQVVSGWIDRSADFDVVNCGTETSLTVYVKRSGKTARAKGYFITGTLPGATNNPYIDLPADMSIETDHSVSAKMTIGWYRVLRTAAGTTLDGGNAGLIVFASSDTDKGYLSLQTGTASASYDVITNPSAALAGNGCGIEFDLEYSVDDWEEFSN